jgi:hypothetical protein
MLERARTNLKVRGKSKREKRDATEVVMSFSAPSPTRPSTNRETVVPSQRDRAKLLRIPHSSLQRVDAAMITKRQQLTAGERGIYWALAKTKRGYSTISDELKSILLDAFNDHPHVVVSPNTKDVLQVKNADGEKVLVRKILTMVGIGTIFSDIVRDHPTVKNKVGERAFRYIVSSLGCVRRFTDSHKTMCGCTECVGLYTLHRSLQAKRGVMARQIAIDAQRRTTKARAEVMARGWGEVALHPKPSDAIRAGTCARWSVNVAPHWECQTLQCANCKEYPVPAEEAREDAGAEVISFHVYEYKVSQRKDGKERRRLELVQKRTTIGEFHRLFYGPALGRGRYHMTSYKLAARCRGERRSITRGSVSSHRDYGERMGLSFNEEIQSGYYQNTSVSVEGASLEWVDEGGAKHTRYFGHWSDDSKQDGATTTRNMRDELCVDGNPLDLVEGLTVGGTVWKGTDGAAVSYRCGKSIYGQSILSSELSVAIDAQVEAPGHGKWWLDGKTGSDKRFCQQCMCSIITPEATDSAKHMQSAKWIDRGGLLVAVSPAAECVRLLSDPTRLNGIKSEGMRAKREGKALVERNTYESYTMDDVPPIPNFKIVFPKGKFNGLRAYYNIRTDPDLGLGFAALRRVACGCNACKEQLGMPWLPRVNKYEQPRYVANNRCILWQSYEGANDWKIFQLEPVNEEEETGARDSIRCVLNALEARMSLTIQEGEVGAVGTIDEAAMGYYIVKWLSEPYALQVDAEGISGIVTAGAMVVDGLYFNRVQRAPYWYTQSGETSIIEVKHVLRSGLHLEEISVTNKLPRACNRLEATRKNAGKITMQEHETIMEEAERRDRLEYNDDEDNESEEEESDDELAESDVDSE